jgi:hypothetical protein
MLGILVFTAAAVKLAAITGSEACCLPLSLPVTHCRLQGWAADGVGPAVPHCSPHACVPCHLYLPCSQWLCVSQTHAHVSASCSMLALQTSCAQRR